MDTQLCYKNDFTESFKKHVDSNNSMEWKLVVYDSDSSYTYRVVKTTQTNTGYGIL